MQISSLHIYPLKSAGGLSMPSVFCEPRGLTNDRRLMVVDEAGYFITQREAPQLARLTVTAIGEQQFSIAANDIDIVHDFRKAEQRLGVTVWNSTVNAKVIHSEALSLWLGRSVKIAMMDDDAQRMTSANWVEESSEVSFADGYPVLIANTASLDALNTIICERAQDAAAAIPMDRFRPNIVIETDEPWAEDTWKRLRIGEVELEITKPCTRCVMVTQDQQTGERMGNEPSATLMRMRRSAHPDLEGVLFGTNAVVRKTGAVSAGDRVEILETNSNGWPLK